MKLLGFGLLGAPVVAVRSKVSVSDYYESDALVEYKDDSSICGALLGYQCNGDDLYDAGSVSQDGECCEKCTKNPECKAFTWNKGGDYHCWLKKSCKNVEFKGEYVSGTLISRTMGGETGMPWGASVPVFLADVDFQGDDINQDQHASTQEECAFLCYNNTKCKAASWNGPDSHYKNNVCNMKSSAANMVKDSGEVGIILGTPAVVKPEGGCDYWLEDKGVDKYGGHNWKVHGMSAACPLYVNPNDNCWGGTWGALARPVAIYCAEIVYGSYFGSVGWALGWSIEPGECAGDPSFGGNTGPCAIFSMDMPTFTVNCTGSDAANCIPHWNYPM